MTARRIPSKFAPHGFPAVRCVVVRVVAGRGGGQAVHDLVPPDALAPVLKQLADQFINDRTRPEAMAVGLKTVRELAARSPLIMTPDLLQVPAPFPPPNASGSRRGPSPSQSYIRILMAFLLTAPCNGGGSWVRSEDSAFRHLITGRDCLGIPLAVAQSLVPDNRAM